MISGHLILPLNIGGEVIELPKEHLAFAPTRQVVIAPVLHDLLKVIRIESVLKSHALERRRKAQGAIETLFQISNGLHMV